VAVEASACGRRGEQEHVAKRAFVLRARRGSARETALTNHIGSGRFSRELMLQLARLAVDTNSDVHLRWIVQKE